MKRIFISLPMRGRTELGIEQERHAIEEWCRGNWRNEDLLFIPPLSRLQTDANPIVCNLGLSIQLIGRSDLVIFSPDWQKAAGCRVEHLVCQEYDIPHIELDHTYKKGVD